MDFQTAFNLAVSLAGALGGWWMKSIYDAIREMRQADIELTERVQQIEVLVAGKYVTRDELTSLTHALFSKLDRMEEKIDRKADKLHSVFHEERR